MDIKDFWKILKLTQEHISEHYSSALTDKDKLSQLKVYIEKYLSDIDCKMEDYSQNELVDRIYSEMAEYSVLTKYLRDDSLEELNINAWNDIALTYRDGRIKKLAEHFHSPSHAVDIVKRLLHHSGMVIDNATPLAQGHLPQVICENGLAINTRITALKEPIVDESCGVSCSIRFLHPNIVDRKNLIETNFATNEMILFLETCIRYGISVVIAGATSSGKTSLLNALLQSVPDNKRIFSIESGSRELSLVRHSDNGISNNVVHTISRQSDNKSSRTFNAYDITQEDLVVASLRLNPDIVAVGEMRDSETYSAVEASLTGHTVVSTVHSGAGNAAHMRIALLCQKKFPIDFNTSLIQSGQAFPIVVYTHKLENNDRKIMDISECEIMPNGERKYHTLYRFNITKNTKENGQTLTNGSFEKPCLMSESLKRKLMQFGVPENELELFLRKEST